MKKRFEEVFKIRTTVLFASILAILLIPMKRVWAERLMIDGDMAKVLIESLKGIDVYCPLDGNKYQPMMQLKNVTCETLLNGVDETVTCSFESICSEKECPERTSIVQTAAYSISTELNATRSMTLQFSNSLQSILKKFKGGANSNGKKSMSKMNVRWITCQVMLASGMAGLMDDDYTCDLYLYEPTKNKN